MTITKVELQDRSGNSPGSWVRFKGFADSRPTVDEIADAQAEEGYHPLGYGGPNDIDIIENGPGDFEVIWTCYASCD